MGEERNIVVGLHLPQFQGDAATFLQSAREDGYDYVTTNLVYDTKDPVNGRDDVTSLESRWWRTSVVGMISDLNNVSLLPTQMEWANHMGIPAVILPPIPMEPNQERDFARAVVSIVLKSNGTSGQVWIKTFLNDTSLQKFATIHKLCDGASNLGMLLCLENMDQPPAKPTGAGASGTSSASSATSTAMVAYQVTMLHKAIGMHMRAMSFPAQVFLTNKRGYPALSKTHQVLFTEALRRVGRTLRVLIEGPSQHPHTNGGATNCLPYLQYIRHMRQRPEVIASLDTTEANQEESYLDHLQRPLQPLCDNLEFTTYETFEKDPVKYAEYQKATRMAVSDFASTYSTKVISILVAGAGRGPLVTAALKAVVESKVSSQISIYAVEKNPSAVVYLQSMARHDQLWKRFNVVVVESDMREMKRSMVNVVADIVISELLGSFGDNELSPECIDSLYKTGCIRQSCVCIPSHYTSYLAPVSSLRLHSEARAQTYFPSNSSEGLDSAPMGTLKAMETPYVVRSHAAFQTHVEQPCWEFVHPARETKISNERTAHIEFRPDAIHGAGCGSGYGLYDQAVASMAQSSGVTNSTLVHVHGFLGTFTATLYSGKSGTATISTRPQTFSVGMFSWFPLYFPLREPLIVPGGASIQCSVWRRVGKERVWYEWCATAQRGNETLAVSSIHNPNGRSYYVSLT